MSENTDTENPVIERPSESASKAVWVEYAVARGGERETVEAMTKAAIIEANPAETEKRTRKPPPDTSNISIEDIDAATIAPQALITSAAPKRARSEQQQAMDAKAVKAYANYIAAGRPSQWEKLPVVTYFANPDDVAGYKWLVRRACDAVEPEPREDGKPVPGVRVRFGRLFTLSEKQANRPDINRPDLAGKTVIAWAAVDKRNLDDGEGSEEG